MSGGGDPGGEREEEETDLCGFHISSAVSFTLSAPGGVLESAVRVQRGKRQRDRPGTSDEREDLREAKEQTFRVI